MNAVAHFIYGIHNEELEGKKVFSPGTYKEPKTSSNYMANGNA